MKIYANKSCQSTNQIQLIFDEFPIYISQFCSKTSGKSCLKNPRYFIFCHMTK